MKPIYWIIFLFISPLIIFMNSLLISFMYNKTIILSSTNFNKNANKLILII